MIHNIIATANNNHNNHHSNHDKNDREIPIILMERTNTNDNDHPSKSKMRNDQLSSSRGTKRKHMGESEEGSLFVQHKQQHTDSDEVLFPLQFPPPPEADRVSPTSVVFSNSYSNSNRYLEVEEAVHVATYDANDPSEDRHDYMLNIHLEESISSSGRAEKYNLSLFGVYDGHVGHACSQFAKDHLLKICAKFIALALRCKVINYDDNAHFDDPIDVACPEQITSVEKALEQAFLHFDEKWLNHIVDAPSQTSCFKGGSFNAGSCAVVVALLVRKEELNTDAGYQRPVKLYTAHCGDCRAVLLTGNSETSRNDIKRTRLSSENSRSLLTPGPHEFMPLYDVLDDMEFDNQEQNEEKSNNYLMNHPYCHLSKAIQLTEDHSANNLDEQLLVRGRCHNAPRAISTGPTGICRVAGSLAVTRALGDAYLKVSKMSFGTYKEHCPYITCLPTVSCRNLSSPKSGDVQILCLASDGVFEKLPSNQSIVQVLNEQQSRQSVGSEVTALDAVRVEWNPSESIIQDVLENACLMRNMTKKSLLSLKKGKARRSKHDDMTCLIVDLEAFL